MKSAILLAVAIAALAVTVVAHQAGLRTRATITSLVVRDVTLIDGSGGTPRPHVDIRNTRRIRFVIKDGRIAFDSAASGRPGTGIRH